MILNKTIETNFFNEARKRITWAQSSTRDLFRNPTNTEVLNTLFNLCHPITGLAQFLGKDKIRYGSALVEKFISRAMDNEEPLDVSQIELLTQMLVALNACIAAEWKNCSNNTEKYLCKSAQHIAERWGTMKTKKCFSKKSTGNNSTAGKSSLKSSFRRCLTQFVAQWLYRLTEPRGGNCDAVDLHLSLDVWFRKQVEEHDDLVIGFVQCKKCNSVWEALACSSTVHKLQCPECNTKQTKVIGAVYDSQIENNDD